MDRERFVKLMAMTTSDNDGEALVALRMANKMLADDKVSWAELLASGPRVTVTVSRGAARDKYDAYVNGEADDWSPPHLSDKEHIEEMFQAVFASTSPGGFHEFLTSIQGHFYRHQRLTPGQYQALRRAYARTIHQYRAR